MKKGKVPFDQKEPFLLGKEPFLFPCKPDPPANIFIHDIVCLTWSWGGGYSKLRWKCQHISVDFLSSLNAPVDTVDRLKINIY